MTIEFCENGRPERILITVEPSELDGYGVSFARMSLVDPPTRVLLHDALALVTRLGLREEGERMCVDCARTLDGGCALLFSTAGDESYRFAQSDDVIAAYEAGALPDGEVVREGDGWRMFVRLKPDAAALLREFCAD